MIRFPSHVCSILYGVHDTKVRIWRHLKRILDIDELSAEKHNVHVILFYAIIIPMAIHMEEAKELYGLIKLIIKHPFMDPSRIDNVTVDTHT